MMKNMNGTTPTPAWMTLAPAPRTRPTPQAGQQIEQNVRMQGDDRLPHQPAENQCSNGQEYMMDPTMQTGRCLPKDNVGTSTTIAGIPTRLIHFCMDDLGRPIPLLHNAESGLFTEQYTPNGVLLKLPVNQPTMIYQTNDPTIFDYPKPVFTRAPAPYILETGDTAGSIQMFYVREVGGRFYKIGTSGELTPIDHSKPVVVYATDGSLFTPAHPGSEFDDSHGSGRGASRSHGKKAGKGKGKGKSKSRKGR
jgi:hypothetical protein